MIETGTSNNRHSKIGRWAAVAAALGLACGPGTQDAETGGATALDSTGVEAGSDPTVASTPTTTDPTASTVTGMTGMTDTTGMTGMTSMTSMTGTGTDPTTTTGPDTDTGDTAETGEPAGFCAPGPSVPRRLTSVQIRNTLRDLLPGVKLPPLDLPENGSIEGFENIADVNQDDPQSLAKLAAAAGVVAAAAAQQGGPWLPCAPDGGNDPTACGHAFLPGFVALALRRALTPEEQAGLLGDFDASVANDGFPAALEATLAGLFASDQFLHLRETLGEPVADQPGVIRLGDFELAARMSYFLWDTMPDAGLHEAAAQGKLATPEGIAEQLALMQADPRSVPALTRFARQWLYMHALEDGAVFPKNLPPALQGPLRVDFDRYVAHLLHDGEGTLAALLSSPIAFVSDDTAPIYEVAPPPDVTQVELDPVRRPGVLTRASWLALRSVGSTHSPFQRGIKILDSLMCTQFPAPPPGTPVEPEDLPPDATTRQLYDTILADAPCAGCHAPAQHIGYGFENYDLLGTWQDEENGQPVDVNGSIDGFVDDITGPFVGASELITRLAGSRGVHDCVTRKTFMYALGRVLGDADDCDLEALQASFFAGGGDFAALQREIVLSDGFRHRLSE